ncbi:MAG: hypothetical protein JO020_11355 [Chloroflexi bacterium]|nr:hypothetical protein [Chloroflexota bacterium]
MRMTRFLGSAGLALAIALTGFLPAASPALADDPTLLITDKDTGTTLTRNGLLGAVLTGAWQAGRPTVCAKIIEQLSQPGDYSAYGVQCNLGGEVQVTSADTTPDGFTLTANVSRSSLSSNFTQPFFGQYADPSASIQWDTQLTVKVNLSTNPCVITPGTPAVPVPSLKFDDQPGTNTIQALNTNVDVDSTFLDVIGGITGFFSGFLFGGVGSIPNAIAGALGTSAIVDGVAQNLLPAGDFSFAKAANDSLVAKLQPCDILQGLGKDISSKHLLTKSVSSSLISLSVESGQPVAGPAYVAHHNLTVPDFQTAFNQLGGQGYRLIDVTGYEDGGVQRLAGIWSQASGPAYQARTGLTAAELGAMGDQLGPQGYRVVRLNGYQIGGAARFAVIWEQRSGPPWAWYFNMTFDDLQSHGDQLGKQGYRMVDLTGYQDAGQVRYAAVWEQRSGPAYQVRVGLTGDDLGAFGDQFGPQGYRMVRISGYQDGNDARYATIWEQKDGPGWAWYFGLNAADYQAAFDRLGFQGYRLAQVSGFSLGGQARFAAYWTQ